MILNSLFVLLASCGSSPYHLHPSLSKSDTSFHIPPSPCESRRASFVTVEAQSAVSAGARRPGPRSGHTLAGHTCPSARSVACEGVSGGDRGTETPQTPGCTRASFRGSFGRVCATLAPRLPEYTPGSYVRFLAWGFQTACVVKTAQRRFF